MLSVADDIGILGGMGERPRSRLIIVDDELPDDTLDGDGGGNDEEELAADRL